MRKFHEARVAGAATVELWGTGEPRREFMHVDDLAAACLFLIEEYEADPHINVGVGQDISISELAEFIAEVVGFSGKLVFDPSKPDGTTRKLLDVSRLASLGWTSTIPLREGIEETYRWYLTVGDRKSAG